MYDKKKTNQRIYEKGNMLITIINSVISCPALGKLFFRIPLNK